MQLGKFIEETLAKLEGAEKANFLITTIADLEKDSSEIMKGYRQVLINELKKELDDIENELVNMENGYSPCGKFKLIEEEEENGY